MPVVHVEDRVADDRKSSSRLDVFGSEQSIKPLVFTIISFLVFFALISFFIIRAQQDTELSSAQTRLVSDVEIQAEKATISLNSQLGWIENVIGASPNAPSLINTLARGNNIFAAAIINGDNQIIQGTENAGFLTLIDYSGTPQSGVLINSHIAENGSVYPVIVRPLNGANLLVALQSGVLTANESGTYAVFNNRNGRPIDGPSNFGA